MVVHPWTNFFDTVTDEVVIEAPSEGESVYREKYRKLSGSSIISPFKYKLSIEDTYSLYLSYRLNQRDYYEEKLTINYADSEYVYKYIPDELNNYLSEYYSTEASSISVYYFDS